ncbi:zinc-ribbon domain-containing protein [Flavobacteriaceae bacterium]|nr:zinc-ribbon domain-containing protein [Flavobacteriaceae bacterium]
MGFFGLGKSRDLINTNGLNERYFDSGKSSKLHSSFYLINGEKDGVYKEFYRNGATKFVGNFAKGKQVGKTELYNNNGNLFRETLIENEIVISSNEYYSSGAKKIQTKNNHHIIFDRKGNKIAEVFLDFKSHGLLFNRTFPPVIYNISYVNDLKSNGGFSFSNKWIIYNSDSTINYDLDFSKYYEGLVIKTDYGKNNDEISSEVFSISNLNFNIIYGSGEHRLDYMDIEPKIIGDVLELDSLSLSSKRLLPFEIEGGPVIGRNKYAFCQINCAKKFILEIKILCRHYDALYEDLDISENTDSYEWESDYICLRYEKHKDFYDSTINFIRPYFVLITHKVKVDNLTVNLEDSRKESVDNKHLEVTLDTTINLSSSNAIPSLNFCTNCGQSISAGDKFCGSCGTKTN